MQKMNQTVFLFFFFTKLTPSPAASALIRAAAHEWYSISAGLELIKLSISDIPCLHTSLHSISTLVFTMLSFLFLFFVLFCLSCSCVFLDAGGRCRLLDTQQTSDHEMCIIILC